MIWLGEDDIAALEDKYRIAIIPKQSADPARPDAGHKPRFITGHIETGKDPLALDTYKEVYTGIKSGRGRKIRSIICAAFLEYFRGNCKQLEWEENAQVYV